MEVSNSKRVIQKTQFNTDIKRQFVPYWNGLLHLVGNVENGVIIRRYDWDNVIKECEEYEKNYLNTENFCESCLFYDIPSSVERIISDAHSRGITDCKIIAQDNDIVFTYCQALQSKQNRPFYWISALVLLVIVTVAAVFFIRHLQHRFQPPTVITALPSTTRPSVVATPRTAPPLPLRPVVPVRTGSRITY